MKLDKFDQTSLRAAMCVRRLCFERALTDCSNHGNIAAFYLLARERLTTSLKPKAVISAENSKWKIAEG